MKRIEERYISLLTDFGFKRIFWNKPNKDLLINFLDGSSMSSDILNTWATTEVDTHERTDDFAVLITERSTP